VSRITGEQVALFEAQLKAQGVNIEDLSKSGGSAEATAIGRRLRHRQWMQSQD
jgi:hypothetical protein